MIKITEKSTGFVWWKKTEEEVYDVVYDLVGDKLADNGISLAQEVAGWADLATVGERYESDEILVECVSNVSLC